MNPQVAAHKVAAHKAAAHKADAHKADGHQIDTVEELRADGFILRIP